MSCNHIASWWCGLVFDAIQAAIAGTGSGGLPWNGKCLCGVPAALRTTKKPGPTHGKAFWSCGRHVHCVHPFSTSSSVNSGHCRALLGRYWSIPFGSIYLRPFNSALGGVGCSISALTCRLQVSCSERGAARPHTLPILLVG
jgi:hypothetical protein